MVTIHPLSRCTWEQTLQLWNEAFADYFVNMNFTFDRLMNRMVREKISPAHSLVAWADGRPVGFVFTAIGEIKGKKVAWNGGTAVLPGWRRKGVGSRLMEALVEMYQREHVQLATLEAIAENKPAIRLYQQYGYDIDDSLFIYQTENFSRKQPAAPGYNIRSAHPATVAAFSFYPDPAPWQTHWFQGDEAWIISDSSGKEAGYALVRRTTDDLGRVQDLTLLQLETAPEHPEAEELARQLLRHVMASAEASRYQFLYCPAKKKMVTGLLEEEGFHMFLNNVHMVKKIAAD
ncbi:GNAT family N-acetyltransferase [Thermoactinomyces sp. FSL K6-2592]|uniref:GNAT family N-acetyltransferase n=2 Tax=unclassified Thermoactinomyces TaxID=2634588 RepID=UPI0030FB250D